MPAVSLTDYTSQQAEITRRQRLADLLTQQGQEDIPIQSYKGTQAPIPWTAVLAKALNSGLGAYEDRKASERQDALHKTMQSAYSDAASNYFGGPATQGPSPAAVAQALPQPPRNDDYAAAAAMPPPRPPQMAQPPPQMPQAAPAPQQMPPPQAMAPPAPPNAPPEPQSPPAATSVAPPVPVSPVQERAAAAQAKMQKALAIQNQFGPQAAAPFLKDAQEQLKAVQDLQDKAAEKEADRAAQVARTVTFVQNSPSIPADYKAALVAGAQVDPDLAKEVMRATIKDAFTRKLVAAGPEDLAGYPQGTVAQKDPKTGKLENIYNPVPNLMAVANEKLHAQEVGLSGARLNLERQRFAAERSDKANAVLDPATIQQMAMQARQGDKSVFQNLGRGTQGAQNIVALRRAIFDPALGPMTGAQMAQMNANFVGATAEQRAVGARVGNAAVAASEVPLLAKVSDDAYAKLSRGELVPYNRLQQMVESGTSSPAQAAAYAADQSVINAYARALSPTGVGTDAARAKGEKMLHTAMGPEAHRAVLNQLITETNAIKSGAAGAMGTGQKPAGPLSGHTLKFNPATGRVE